MELHCFFEEHPVILQIHELECNEFLKNSCIVSVPSKIDFSKMDALPELGFSSMAWF